MGFHHSFIVTTDNFFLGAEPPPPLTLGGARLLWGRPAAVRDLRTIMFKQASLDEEDTLQRGLNAARTLMTKMTMDLGGSPPTPAPALPSSSYNPESFGALRNQQVLEHQRNGALSERKGSLFMAVTWNVAGMGPDDKAVVNVLGPAPSELPDLVCVGMQEIVDLTAREVLRENREAASQWQRSFERAFATWLPVRAPEESDMAPAPKPKAGGKSGADSSSGSASTLSGSALRNSPYVLVSSVQLVGILLLVFVRRDHAPNCQHVRSTSLGTGALGFLGNKGAVAVRLRFYFTNLCFVCAHLSAHKSTADVRNAEARLIEDRLSFSLPKDALNGQSSSSTVDDNGPGSPSVTVGLKHHDVVVWVGDLNYRLEGVQAAKSRKLVQDGALEELLKFDQLREAQRKGHAFETFEEAPISFPPTYKYDRSAPAARAGRCAPDVLTSRAPARCPRLHGVRHV